MIPHPTAIGLVLCERVIVEERTRNVSLIATFTTLNFPSLPASPRSLALYTVLTDGRGAGLLDLVVTRLDTNEEIHALRRPITFPDQLHELQISFRLERILFPVPGLYLFTLLVDGAWVAHRRLRVNQEELS